LDTTGTPGAFSASIDESLSQALSQALAERSAGPLRTWLATYRARVVPTPESVSASASPPLSAPKSAPIGGPMPNAADLTPLPKLPILTSLAAAPSETRASAVLSPAAPSGERRARSADVDSKFGRRAEDAQVGKVLKVDQIKVDQLMNLIGEMVVAKNSLPYLANRAENQFGVRELAREIKAQYAVINRIAEEMQDAIMQVRMTPVSLVFQRFPRLVRDISRKLGKEVELVLEGEETEADKNIVEALADPLVHIVRNSLDHGLELPEQRLAAGKPRTGKLIIRAVQEADRVLIEIIDDGHGIDPAVIKRKAYEKGIIDEATLERIGDQEAINLVFGAGFSTAESISDLSGRGVGMDVVRSAIDKVGGTAMLSSTVGKGTTLRLSLPLSMAVTNVMIVESARQIFGVPMEMVVETVRLPSADIRCIKRQKTTVLRNHIVPLASLNHLLAVPSEPIANADGEYAALVVRIGGEQVGLLVDDFREVVDVILKPLPGELAKLSAYAGTALLGDGSVLMILNPKELF
jgi:two-component system chemotaxis sensor kinase CheA